MGGMGTPAWNNDMVARIPRLSQQFAKVEHLPEVYSSVFSLLLHRYRLLSLTVDREVFLILTQSKELMKDSQQENVWKLPLAYAQIF